MTKRPVSVIPVAGLPEISEGDDLAGLLLEALDDGGLIDHDIVVFTQKVVSKAEGRVVAAEEKAAAIETESRSILRRTAGGMVISETRHGFVCANAGVDSSNIDLDHIVLLPIDPDASARRIRARLQHLAGVDVGVVVSDTFGRAWRLGQTDVAIGLAGFEAFVDYRSTHDTQGRELFATRIAVADQIAGAAELVMGKADHTCAAIVRGAEVRFGRGAAVDLVRSPADDLFR
ncbi:MAG: coenzyme F420-0:L-glutamate ligase [Actinomycetota bacterium]